MSETSEQCCPHLQVGQPAPAFKATAVVGSAFEEVSYENEKGISSSCDETG